MFASLHDALTRENWERHRTAIELAVALLVGVIGVVSSASSPVRALASLCFAALILLHRRAPLVALSLLGVGTVLSVALGGYGPFVTPPIVFAVLVVVFGASAYGRPIAAWLGLAYIAVAALVVPASIASYSYFGGVISLITNTLALFLTITLLGLAWTAGWLLRIRMQRDDAKRQHAAAAQERDVAAERGDRLEQDVTLEQERNRVAREVHDVVAHSLAVVIAQADGARYAAKADPSTADEALATIAATARGSLSEVRALLTSLRHSQEAGPQPGMGDIDALVRGFRESGLEIVWTSYGQATPLGDVAGLAVYRVVQEALTNALRHGDRGVPVELEFDWAETWFTVTVTNAVAGESDPTRGGGHGIPGMRERAALAGGSLTAGVGTNGRFRVRGGIPIDRSQSPTQAYVRPAAERRTETAPPPPPPVTQSEPGQETPEPRTIAETAASEPEDTAVTRELPASEDLTEELPRTTPDDDPTVELPRAGDRR
jgi:signal transduction histidine kinase